MQRAGSGSEPPYLRIVREIERRIHRGELRPGDRVPSIRQAAAQWGWPPRPPPRRWTRCAGGAG
ncbi:GntR family transcriptional regulator [Nonomuraea antimicrobica]